MKKRVRIIDVAEHAGVSPGTVDRVIHNRGKVSPEKREEVLKVMKELGYERNIAASILAKGENYRVAVLLPDYNEDPYWKQPFAGAEEARKQVQHFGLNIEYYFFKLLSPEDFDRQARNILKTQPDGTRPDGILFSPLFLNEGEELLNKCDNLNIPCVIINTNLQSSKKLSYIGQHSYQSGVLAARLLNFGTPKKRTVIILNLTKGSTNAKHLIEKKEGFQYYFDNYGNKKVKVVNLEFEEFNDNEKLKTFLQGLIEKYTNLSGIFFTNSRAYKAIQCLDEKIVKKIKIIGFDLIESNLNYLREDKINFLINQNPIEQGFLGIQTLYKHLVEKEAVEPIQYLPLDIVVKENMQYYQKRGYQVETLLTA